MATSTDNAAPMAPTFQGYLYLVLTGKTGNTWQVRVFGENPKHGYFMEFEYSSYMCFINDAKSWNNINSSHIKTVTTGIPAFKGVDIEITENWFADGIAVSYKCADGKRYITSANFLSKWDWTMTQHNTSVVY